MAAVEKGHADYFEQRMGQAKIKVPVATPTLAALGDVLAGEAVELVGPVNTCRLGITFESKAVEMYQAFILGDWSDPVLRDTLWHFLVDEEMHLLWMQDCLNLIQSE